jgi:hypothetical protein
MLVTLWRRVYVIQQNCVFLKFCRWNSKPSWILCWNYIQLHAVQNGSASNFTTSASYLILASSLLGAFAKLRNATISFVMSVCPSVCMEQLGSHWKDLHEIYYLGICRESVQKIQVSLKCDKNNGYFTWKPTHIFVIPRFFILKIRNVSYKIVEEIKTPILFSATYFRKLCYLWDNVKKYSRAGQTTDDNMAHAYCMLII